ncbi:gastrula zinc finger protein XlCGF57.1-like [Zophobas morio]|uniref:gastrula zinc finger protein XlCGF57.1-like n=1 Tax=Zophobas morio TaxID=2755281 RepID=UPI003083376B
MILCDFLSEKESFECSRCSKTFPSKLQMQKHMPRHKEQTLKCPHCNRHFIFQSEVKRHMSEVHAQSAETFKCEICDFTCKTKRTLKNHGARVHTKDFLYKCQSCDKGYMSRDALDTHEKIQHQGVRHVCQHCGKVFLTETCFTKHCKSHDPDHIKEVFTCQVCLAVLRSYSGYSRHMKRHNGQLPSYVCDICGKRVNTAESLNYHKKTHIGEKNYLCGNCGKGFITKQTLIEHTRVHTKERPFPCLVCSKRFTQKSSLNVHMRRHTGERPYGFTTPDGTGILSCSRCQKTFSCAFKLRKHMYLHNKTVKCLYCEKYFSQKYMMMTHVNNVHVTVRETFKCEICDYTSKYKLSVKTHTIRKHTKDFAYKCETCGKKYPTKSQLEIHEKINHQGLCHVCKTCGKVFKSEGFFKKHCKAHDPDYIKEVFTCEICSTVLRKAEAYRNHMQRHSGQAINYVCDICGKVITSLQGLKKHKRIHTGEKNFLCVTCGKDFVTNQSLIMHTRVHTKERPFQCLICTKRFTQKSSLNIHMRYHTGERPFEFCDWILNIKFCQDQTAFQDLTPVICLSCP